MSVWGKLFGSDKVIDAAIDTGDKIFHTSEEKAEHYLKVMQMYQAFKLAQRLIAMITVPPYALAWFITFLCVMFDYGNVKDQLELLSGDMGKIVFAIVAFYFMGGAAEGAVKALRRLKD